jgi:hypothetical protein
MSGFGNVQPFPGLSGVHVNLSLTLPIGIEAYATYALAAAFHPGVNEVARRFAKRSAIGSLALGFAGQGAFHIMSAMGVTHAPWFVVLLVSAVPVVTLGLGAALAHLMAHGESVTADLAPDAITASEPVAPETHPEPLPGTHSDALVPEPVSVTRDAPRVRPEDTVKDTPETPRRAPRKAAKGTRKGKSKGTPEDVYAALLAAGELPSIRAIKRDMHVGDDKARTIRADLESRLKPNLSVVG